MNKTNKEKITKKVRKEIKPKTGDKFIFKFDEPISSALVISNKDKRVFDIRSNGEVFITVDGKLVQVKTEKHLSLGLAEALQVTNNLRIELQNKIDESRENTKMTILIVTLALLTALAIYKSL